MRAVVMLFPFPDIYTFPTSLHLRGTGVSSSAHIPRSRVRENIEHDFVFLTRSLTSDTLNSALRMTDSS